MGAAVVVPLLRVDPAQVAGSRPLVGLGVGVEDLLPEPGLGQTDPVVVQGAAREVDHAGDRVARVIGTQERQRVVLRVVGVDPREPRRVVVERPQPGVLRVACVHVPDRGEDAAVVLALPALEVLPGDALFVVPLADLTELHPLEDELLPGVRPHVGVKSAQPGRAVPRGPRHALPHRSLAVDHLVVAEREDEPLAPGVHQGEGDLAVVVSPVDGVEPHIAQRVVHPPHVPLHGEPETAGVRGCGDAAPGGRLLGDHEESGVLPAHGGVDLLQERDGLEVLSTAVAVGGPLALVPRVVQVEHRGDGVHAQAVDVELLRPVQGVGHQEVADLVTTEVEHVGAPVGLLTATGVRVLVQRGPVEAAEGPLVLGEVRGHPVHQHADAARVQVVDHIAQVVRGAETTGGGVVGGHLVAP